MEIGWFQLENLFLSRNLFYTVIDLRQDPKVLGKEHIDRILESSVKLKLEDIPAFIHGEKLPSVHPFVLLDEDGRKAKKAAVQLEKLGFSQVYILEDGEAGLLSE